MSSERPAISRLDDLLFAEPHGDELLVHAAGVDHSRSDVVHRATALAERLRSAGVEPGHAVGVMLRDGVDVVAALFAVWHVGAVYVPLNPRLGTADLAHVLESVAPALVVAAGSDAQQFHDAPVLDLDRVADDADADDADQASGVGGVVAGVDARRYDDDVALIQFTSGTTGRPKAVLLEHPGVIELLDGVLAKIGSTGGSRRRPMPNLVPVSLSLWAGIYNVLFALRVGAAVVVMDGFDTTTFARLVRRFEIRSTVLPPAAMAMLSDDETIDDLAPLAFVRSITAPLSPLQARRFRERFGLSVLNSYGQTEIGGEIIGWNAADAREHGDDKLGAVGRPHQGVEVRTAETGELQVRTPAMSAGYADGSDLGDRITDDGWFRTGDVGRVDDDGFVWIEGRVSDMINRGGLKVFPAEVEEVLRLSPGVRDAAVVPVADERLGEVPVAYVVADPSAASAALGESLKGLCSEHLAPYKVPVAFHLVDELPRNEVGKVLKHELSARAAD